MFVQYTVCTCIGEYMRDGLTQTQTEERRAFAKAAGGQEV